LSASWTQELAYIADELTKVYLLSLANLERHFEAKFFPFLSDREVALCTVPKWLWREIIRFSNAHDYEKGTGDWYMFDSAPANLKPYTNTPHPKYDPGYHGVFYARENVEGIASNDNVLIIWSPPGQIGEVIQDRNWWSCDYAYGWFNESLIPEVGEWLERKQRRWKFLPSTGTKKFHAWWSSNAKSSDIRRFPLAQELRYGVIGLVKTVEELQIFFHGYGPQQRIYVSSEEVHSLYSALILLLAGRRGYPGYIAGSLSIGTTCNSHDEIIKKLLEKIQENKIHMNSTTLDFFLRAMLEAISDDESWIAPSNKEFIFSALKPLMKFFDQETLMERHCRWI
jgi:hypothetical protein